MDANKICDMLNSEQDQRPALIRTMISTVWTVDGVPEHIDVAPFGEDFCTGIIGVINGCLRATNSHYIVGTLTVKDSIKFIPVYIGATNEEVPFTKETEQYKY